MQIVRVDRANIELLRAFISRMGKSSSRFRYFRSRPVDIIGQHIVTLIGLDDAGVPTAYGHLDRENGIVWLGLCVIEGCTGRGHGREMIGRLLAEAVNAGVSSISLSVDQDNHAAISLYKRFGFELRDRKDMTCFFRREQS
jgi:RimJ/RimL family protein N-acetyltransferase